MLYVFVMLAQLSGCASVVCSESFEGDFAVQRTGIFVREVEDVLPIGDEAFVLVARDPEVVGVRTLSQIGPNGETTVATIPPLFPYDAAPSLNGTDGRWWFARCGVRNMKESVYFVTGGKPIQARRVDVTLRFSDVWLPLRGERPRGLLASVSDEDSTLVVEEVTPGGLNPLAQFPMASVGTELVDATWSAEEVGEDRFVIVSVDNPVSDDAPKLRFVGEETASESTLECPTPIRLTLATALAPDGKLAVVGLSNESEVVAALIDIEHPESAQCRVISSTGETAVYALSGTPSVVWTGDRFIAAWIREDGTVRACEFTDLHAAPFLIDVGQDAAVISPLRQLVHAGGDHVTFVWKDRWNDLALRRMPKEITRFEAAVTLRRYLCAASALFLLP